MTNRIHYKLRVDRAARALLTGRSCTGLVAELAENEGISRRHAQRIVREAYELICGDIDSIDLDRKKLTAQLVLTLQEAMAIAMKTGHVSAAVGASRELRKLVGLGPDGQKMTPRERYMHHA